MPQLAKGGKFVFGKSLVREGYVVRFPPRAAQEYDIAREGRVYLITGSKSTGGFCVTRKGLLYPSKIGNILRDTPALQNYELPEGEFVRYKGRSYCWTAVSPDGTIALPAPAAAFLRLAIGMELLCIRSSDIAFVMGAKGPLLEQAAAYDGVIDVF